MPLEIRRWFVEPDYAKPSIQDQDWDLILATWDYLPLLIEYCEDPANPLEKRFEAFSALMVLDSAGAGRLDDDRRSGVNREIKRIVLGNRDFAHQVCGWLGVAEALSVKRMLGEEIPQDVPQWMREEIKRRA